MFILVLQFFWVYVDDLMGKGLSTWVILELLFFVSASLIPLALPLAILLSSLMTFGNLSEYNELTALKASGLSLYRIIRPLFVVVIGIAIGTFYFANYVIPVANLKWHSLIYSIQNTKISTVLTPGVYTKDFEGYAIKVREGKDSVYYGVTIHDHTNRLQIKTVKAKEARIYKSENGKYLFFDLKDGRIFEETNLSNGNYLPNGELQNPEITNRPHRVSEFTHGTYKLNLSGFTFNRSDDDTFSDKYEMMNVFQITEATDSIQKKHSEIRKSYADGLKTQHPYFSKLPTNLPDQSGFAPAENPSVVQLSKLSKIEQKTNAMLVVSKLRNSNKSIDNQILFQSVMDRDEKMYWIEFHRKFALTYAIIVLFFIGAPLGAIIRKGGFGAPVVIAALVFMIYFILTSIGDNLARTFVVSPFVGMWMAGFFFTPIAILTTYAAANDSKIFSFESWKTIFKRKNKA
jgi:lipopolysaccharide export system permease protein